MGPQEVGTEWLKRSTGKEGRLICGSKRERTLRKMEAPKGGRVGPEVF